MADPFLQNLERYRRGVTPLVGGSEHSQGRLVVAGRDPPAFLEFISDGVMITDAAPTVNQYRAAPLFWATAGGANILFINDTLQQEVYWKFESPATNLDSLMIRMNQLFCSGDSINPSPDNAGAEVFMRLHLIKASLELGEPFGLDALTFTTGNHTDGTLFNDATRFDSNGPFDFRSVRGAGGSLFQGSIVEGEGSLFQDGVARGSYLVFNPVLTQGPYTGILMFLFRTGVDVDNELASAGLRGDIRSKDLDERSFAIPSELLTA